MKKDFTIFVGTVGMGGAGIWRSPDGGDTWSVPRGSKDEMNCCALAVDPNDSAVIYAGLRNGIYRSDDRGVHFYRLESPVNAYEVWSVAIHPTDPAIVFAGCRPGAIFRTRDGGERWEQCAAEFAAEGVFGGPARVLRMIFDPVDHDVVWAGVEADGIRMSRDGGERWRDVSDGLTDRDIHGLAISAGTPHKLFASADLEVFTTVDAGESWQPLGVQERFAPPNCRHIEVKTDDPNTLFLALGGDDNSVAGAALRSTDRGESWHALEFPEPPNTPIWNFAINPADPALVLCSSHYGQVFISENAGDNWRKVAQEFSEIRALAWTSR